MAFCRRHLDTCIYVSATVPLARSGVSLRPCRSPGPWIELVIRGQQPDFLRLLACPCMPPQTRFSIIFLNMFRHRFRCHLGPILVPTWPQLDLQNQPKIDPRAIQTPSQLASCFRWPSGSIFQRICMDFWFPNRSKINQNSIKKSTKHYNNQKTKKLIITRQGRWNRALGHVMLYRKIDKNCTNMLQKTGLESML